MKECKQCKSQFEVNDDDRQLYDKLEVPEPTHCPNCRMQRRMAFRNERKVYRRKCDVTGKDIISVFKPGAWVKVADKDFWFNDKFNPIKYGREFDFNRPFFDQFKDLMKGVPFPSLRVEKSENCDFNVGVGSSKNCYLCARTHDCQDMLYVYRGNLSNSCTDCFQVIESELCFECVECVDCYNCKYTFFSSECKDSSFLIDCRGCTDCFMCTNLRQKKYCFLNEQLTKEEYLKKLEEFDFSSYKHVQKAFKLFKDIKNKAIHRDLILVNCEDCVGDNLYDCKNCYMCFGVKFAQDCRYMWDVMKYKDSADIYSGGRNSELCYETTSVAPGYNVKFCFRITYSQDVSYSMFCGNVENLFGCIGLKHKKFCILNKQYAEGEYKELVTKIIEHMKKNGEYGEFFPITLSPFAYNETTANEYFPLDKKEVESRGWAWHKEEETIPDVKKTIPASKLPDNIKDIPDDVLNWAIICEITDKPFKIVPQELQFYRNNNLPIPRLHPDERHKKRVEFKRRPYLFDHKCSKCNADIRSSFAPDRPETVYCDQCYLKEVY